MPHKHKRRRLNGDADVDLPPSSIAKPLPVGKIRNEASKKTSRKLQNAYKDNDTPKAFVRLLNFRKTGRGISGLDNGDSTATKSKSKEPSNTDATSNPSDQAPQVPTILPGESISDFSARVDRTLPVVGLATRGKKVEGIPDHRVTKHERRLKRIQGNWRKEDARLKAKAEEEQELAEEEEAEERELWEERNREVLARKGKKMKRKLVVGEVPDDDDDPWAILKKRDKPRALTDVVQAPPTFKSLPREKFKIRDGAKVDVADVPIKAGSLRRREELAETRKDVIARYRQMMNKRNT